APEVVVPSAVLGRRRGVPSADEEEERAERHRLRVGVAAGLVLIGLVVVVIAIKGLVSSGESKDLATTGTSTTAAGSTTTSKSTPGGAPGSTAAPTTGASEPASTAPKGGGRYTVHPTRCAQTGSQLTAEGNLTNLDTSPHSYRVTVVFTSDGQKQA